MMQLSIVLFVCLCILGCQCRPDGAPQSACSSLTPAHKGIKPQRSSAPFSVSAVKLGNKVRVRIYSTVGEEFEGFILQARSGKNRNQIINGIFTQTDNTKTVDCFNGRKNTLTQVSPNEKREIVTEWTPNQAVNEDIVFRATVLKTYAYFWTEVDSSTIRITSSGDSERQSRKESDNIYDSCFMSKGCFGLPSGCIDSQDCEVLLAYTNSADGVSFKMTSFLEPNTYMAMGLSTDAKMGDDSVTECIRQGSTIRVRESWNAGVGKDNNRIRELPRDKYESEMVNGITTCSWTAEYLKEANGRKFDLANSTYHVLLAKGPMQNERLGYHADRIATQEPVSFVAFESIEAGGISDSIKIHGHTEENSFTSTDQTQSVLTDVSRESTSAEIGDLKPNSNSGALFTASLLSVLVFLGLTI